MINANPAAYIADSVVAANQFEGLPPQPTGLVVGGEIILWTDGIRVTGFDPEHGL